MCVAVHIYSALVGRRNSEMENAIVCPHPIQPKRAALQLLAGPAVLKSNRGKSMVQIQFRLANEILWNSEYTDYLVPDVSNGSHPIRLPWCSMLVNNFG